LIDGPYARWVNTDVDGLMAETCEELEGISQARPFAGSQVVNFPSAAMLSKQSVGTHHVADICEVANHVKVTNFNAECPPGLNLSDLAGKGR
jgi:hypothetical protein